MEYRNDVPSGEVSVFDLTPLLMPPPTGTRCFQRDIISHIKILMNVAW